MKCTLRGDFHCSNENCKYEYGDDTPENNALCTLNAIVQSLDGYSQDIRLQELTDLIIGKDTPDNIRAVMLEELEITLDRFVAKFVVAVPLTKAKTAIEQLGYPNFTYDRKTGLVFLDFAGGSHDIFMVTMYWINALKAGKATPDTDGLFSAKRESFCLSDMAEKFVTDGYGFFSSSVYKGMGMPQDRGYAITFSRNHKLNAQERRVFEAYGFDPIGPVGGEDS